METRKYTIGDAARASGVPVRRIRFYADRGLLTLAGRTEGNYRLFTDADLVRLDLIAALRGAGVGLDAIACLLADRLPLAQILRARLAIIEEEIAAGKRVAAVLRTTLRKTSPSSEELRRLWTTTSLSNAQVGARVDEFIHQVSRDAMVDDTLRRHMRAAMTPELPPEPTPEQIDAWNALVTMLQDPAFVAELQGDMKKVWTSDFQASAYRQAAREVMAQARAAMAAGHPPASADGARVAAEWLRHSTQAMKVPADHEHSRWLLESYARQRSGRPARYRALMAVLQPDAAPADAAAEWAWLHAAIEETRS